MLMGSGHVAEQDLLATPAAFDGYDFVAPDKLIQAHATATGKCTQAVKSLSSGAFSLLRLGFS